MSEKGCNTCKYEELDSTQEPCKDCYSFCNYQPADDPVNPSHYADSCSLECIDVMEALFGSVAVRHFCLCNAFKYMWRYKNKNGQEDLKKAKWYLDYAGTVKDDQLKRLEDLLEKINEE